MLPRVTFSGQQAAGQAGDEVHCKYHEIYLSLFQMQFIQGKCQGSQEDSGQHIGDEQGADHGFYDAIFHRIVLLHKNLC